MIGTAADLVNAGWYASEGRYTEAAASAFSAIPGIGDAFAAGKMGVKLATAAPKVMKTIKTASHLAPMAPVMFQAGEAALEGDFAKASLTAGSAFVPTLGTKAGQRLLSKPGSKVQALAAQVLMKGSQAAPNAIGATQVAQTVEAYQNGEGSAWEVAKSVLYTAAPFAIGRGGKKIHNGEAHSGKNHEAVSKAKDTDHPKHDHDTDGNTAQTKDKTKRGESEPELTPERQQMRKEGETLQKALPKRQQVPVEVDQALHGNTVQVHYSMDKKGQVVDVHIKAGPEATAKDIELHGAAVKRMQQYSGLSRHVQGMKDRIHGWVNKNGTPPVGSKAWEAQLEVNKLPKIIEERANRLGSGGLDEKSQLRLEAELADLKHQLATHEKTLKAMDKEPGSGFVAAQGDFPMYETPFNPLSADQRRALRRKRDDRTISKEEYERLDWDRRFANRRQRGVDRFWAKERRALRSNQPGTRSWTPEQRDDILAGRTPKFNDKAIEGHHKYNTLDHPQIADDGANIYPASWDEHFSRWHGENFQNDTFGKPIDLNFTEQF